MTYAPENRSNEHGSFIVESLETGRLYRGHFNMVNNGAVGNLPADAIVEGPGLVDATGIRLLAVGDLPPGPAGICNASITVQRLAVEAAVTGDDELLRQAMMLDPLFGAVCSPSEIWQLVDEMLVSQKNWLPQYTDAIAGAERRIAGKPSGSARATQGGFRRPVRTSAGIRASEECQQ